MTTIGKDTVTAILTATLPDVKDGDCARHHPRFLPRGLTLAASSNGMALPLTYAAVAYHLVNAENVFGEILTDVRVNISFTSHHGGVVSAPREREREREMRFRLADGYKIIQTDG